MKSLLALALLVTAVGVGYPLLNEDTGNMCSAVERRLITSLPAKPEDAATVLFLAELQLSVSDGSFATALVKERTPNVPPLVSCDLAYWRLVFDQRQANSMFSDLLRFVGAQAPNPHAAEPIRSLSPAMESEKAMRALTNPTAPVHTPDARQ